MDAGMIAFFVAMGFALIVHGGLWYLIVKKKRYELISGFALRPKEEQELLMENGYVEATGKLLFYSWWLLFIAVLAYIFRLPYVFEIGLAVFLVFLLGGTIYIQRYEVKRKRKKYIWLTSGIAVAVIALIVVLGYYGFRENEVVVQPGKLIVMGEYGEEWSTRDIEEVQLLKELPEVVFKANGFAAYGRLKGEFVLEKPYGRGKLFIVKSSSPYLYVKRRDGAYIMLNRRTPEETKELFQALQQQMDDERSSQ